MNIGNNWSSLINALVYNQFTFVIGPWDIPIPQNGVIFLIHFFLYSQNCDHPLKKVHINVKRKKKSFYVKNSLYQPN